MNIKERIASRVAQELQDGDVVNLGIGIPTLVANYIDEELNVFIHSENGILGVGPHPKRMSWILNLVNAGKLPVTVNQGASFFDSASSFAMIRGGHIDVAILGVLEIDEKGIIANWALPGEAVLGVGGAMDLLEGVQKVIVATTHTTKDGRSKIVKQLNYPHTSTRRADLIVTELAVFSVDEEGLTLKELAPSVRLAEVQQKTEASFKVGLKNK